MKIGNKLYTHHADITVWMSKLKFYSDEIAFMKSRLEVIASKTNQNDVLTKVEHFQNQFIIQKNNIDELTHIIRVDVDALEKEVNKNPIAVDHREILSHSGEKDAVNVFEKNFNELRSEFKTFAAKWI